VLVAGSGNAPETGNDIGTGSGRERWRAGRRRRRTDGVYADATAVNVAIGG
jgi:hypothetical protein